MRWLAGILVLTGVGFLLRRLLWVNSRAQRAPAGLAPLGPERQAVYDGFAPEVEARTVMLGISLNDAFEERGAGRHDMAWRMIRLSAAEWDGMAKIAAGLAASTPIVSSLGPWLTMCGCMNFWTNWFSAPGAAISFNFVSCAALRKS
jgi:hypothetical protein